MKHDGGPAFGSLEIHGHGGITHAGGMSLRDWFAGQALAGIAGHFNGPEKREGETGAQAHARWSYQVADAMLAERAK